MHDDVTLITFTEQLPEKDKEKKKKKHLNKVEK